MISAFSIPTFADNLSNRAYTVTVTEAGYTFQINEVIGENYSVNRSYQSSAARLDF